MKKYKPSIANNNELKNDFLKSAKSVLYKVEKGKTNPNLDNDSIKPIIDSLNEVIDKLENAIGTGEENIYPSYENSLKALTILDKSFEQELVSIIEEATDDVIFYVSLWMDLLDGNNLVDTFDVEKSKASFSRRRLINRLSELKDIKEQFQDNEKRLEKEIISLEKNANELDELILKEDNERRINDLYRQITTLKSKKDSLNIRKSNYSACFNLLDIIYANANEIVVASEYSNIDLAKAKALLNLGKLKQVITEPDKAISILNRMEKEIQEIKVRTETMDNKIYGVNKDTTIVSSDALAYKEMLLKKKRDQENLQDILNDEIKQNVEEKNEVKGDK